MERYDFDFQKAPEFSGLRKKLESYENVLGRTEVEEGIWDSVAVLTLLGFKTKSSCEGHIEPITEASRSGDVSVLVSSCMPYVGLKVESEAEFKHAKMAIQHLLNEFMKKEMWIQK